MLFEVLTGEGLNNNAAKAGNRLATNRQTELEHAKLLDEKTTNAYRLAIANPNPAIKNALLNAAKQEAIAREAENPKYWLDNVPRRYISQSSSWVGDINYDPEQKLASIHLGNKIYTYPGVSPEGMARLLNSNSLGQFLNRVKPYVGQDF